MKAQQGSLIPSILDKLVELLGGTDEERAAAGDDVTPKPAGLEDVQILYGPPAQNEQVANDVLEVAPGDHDSPGVTVSRERQPGMGRMIYETRTEVLIMLATYKGETDMKSLIAHTSEIFDGVKKLVDANPRVDACWDRLVMGGSESWGPVQTDQGATVVVLFSVVATTIG